MRSDALASGFDPATVIGVGAVWLVLPIITEVALSFVFKSDWYKSKFGDSSKNKFIASSVAAYLVLDTYGLDLFAMLATAFGHPVSAGTIGTAISATFMAGGRGATETLLRATGLSKLFSGPDEVQRIENEDN